MKIKKETWWTKNLSVYKNQNITIMDLTKNTRRERKWYCYER